MPADQVPRNLAVDNEVLVPVNKVVHVLVTSTDVIHAWTIPSFGSKVDAVPGRITATWFKADEGRHLLRPVLRAVRQGSRLHADRRARGEGAGVRRLGGGAEGARQAESAKEIIRNAARRAGRQPRRPTAGRRDSQRAAWPSRCRAWREQRRCEREGRRHGRPSRRSRTITATTTSTRPTASGAGCIRPTTKTSARCTCCSPSWAA